MLDRILFGSKVLEKSLDATATRNEVIAQNIANVDTPGYKRKTVSFEEQLSDAISKNSSFKGRRTDPRHIAIGGSSADEVKINVSEDKSSLDMRLDGNNVDIENEMAQMAENNIRYEVLIQRISGSFSRMKSVIKEGR
ncbi:flagellar basal body rod protein FlgB [Acetivibrio cellulolyticus]|uniref:flagellar basal body rod protein FlgB n=1 Tax=Acetivibrio cellulolyticus TaxID=35830 RepID=UPI0001E2C252|nr:flagellar basal body rod protein FlgB [Acetivibrio cellulolyticus]